MKKYLAFLSFAAFIACNNNTSKESTAGENGKEPTPEKKESSAKSGGCGDLALFHEGAVIEGKNYDAEGKETGGQVTTITRVKSTGGETTADAKIDMHSSFGGKEHNSTMNITYKCDGKHLYMDLGAMMANFSALQDAKVETASLEFPLQVRAGEALPDATVSVEMDRGGRKTKVASKHTNRKVEDVENISTPAGAWDCYKITSTIETNVEMGNTAAEKKIADMMRQKSPQVKMVMWYAPGVGIVKTEMYSNEKLSSHTEVVSIKD